MNNETLRQLQLTQLEMLKIFDKFCSKHNLKYSLYAGSLLGAVRHKAFIPWDDDLDVCMSREEYDRFIELWEEEGVEGYILQNKENTPGFTQSFTKIRKDNTTFLQEDDVVGKYHTGIFLDVFPLDRIPSEGWKRKWFKWNCMCYQLLTREFIPKDSSNIVRFGCKCILALTPVKDRKQKREQLLKKITSNNGNCELEIAAIETKNSIRIPFASNMLDNYVYLPFEDGQFMCFADWHDHLSRKFGNYMELPPVESRECKHHPIIIDFEHNYDEIVKDI